MDEIIIKHETFPRRCEICHQSDLFDQKQNNCKRCRKIKFFEFNSIEFIVNSFKEKIINNNNNNNNILNFCVFDSIYGGIKSSLFSTILLISIGNLLDYIIID